MQVRNRQRTLFQLEREIARGGEARIWTVQGNSNLVAKIYEQPTGLHEAKLKAMLQRVPTQPRTHIAIAWPTDLLYQQRRFVGFLMPRIQRSEPIFNFYNPAQRKQSHPGFNWRDLHRTALNLVLVAEIVHVSGHVIGDVNQSNVLVNGQALVTLVDTDSFQVRAQQIYRCPVGQKEYTPPELQDANFKNVNRTVEHDHFGLAVLIFQLLMEGHHPFGGVLPSHLSVGRADLYCIKRGLFPYHKNASVSPPPKAPSFDTLHPHIQAAFVRCFVDGHRNPKRRLTIEEWKSILERAMRSLVRCRNNHYFADHRTCPKCHQNNQSARSSLISSSSMIMCRCGHVNVSNEIYCQSCLRQLSGKNTLCQICNSLVPINTIYCLHCGFHTADSQLLPTIACPNCGYLNAAHEVYCQNCVYQLSVNQSCPQCYHSVPANALYCLNCGQQL